MPYIEANIPLRGWITDSPFSRVPDGFTSDVLNMLPSDSFRRKVRLGTRPATNRLYEFPDETKIQFISRNISYNQLTAGAVPTRTDRVFIIADGKIYYLDPTSTTPTQVAHVNGSSNTGAVLNTTGNVEGVQLGQYLYLVDGTHYVKVDLFSYPMNIISVWGGTGANAPITNVSNTVNSVVYTATLIAKYGARLVLSGVKGKENLWWMSEILNPDHWNPIANNFDAGTAIAASSAPAIGPAGDEIICMFELGTAGFVFAGKRSLTYLTGDPAIDVTQTSLVTMSQTVGAVNSRSWAFGPEKSIYLLSQDGLYKIRPNDFNIDTSSLISLNKLDSFFNRLRFGIIDTVLHYDVERRGLWIFMTRTDGPYLSTHLFFSEQTQGFFPVRFYDPKMYGSQCCCQFTTAEGRNQIMLMSYDNMIGFMDQRLISGIDGYAASGYSTELNPTDAESLNQFIGSYVSLGPLEPKQPSRLLIKELQVELGADDYNPITLSTPATKPIVEVRSGETSQEANSDDIQNISVTALVSPTSYDGGKPDDTFYSPAIDGGLMSDYSSSLATNSSDPRQVLSVGNYLYIVDSTNTKIEVWNISTRSFVTNIIVNAAYMAYSPITDRIYTVHPSSTDVTLIDPNTNAIDSTTPTVSLGSGIFGRNLVYSPLDTSIVVLDTALTLNLHVIDNLNVRTARSLSSTYTKYLLCWNSTISRFALFCTTSAGLDYILLINPLSSPNPYAVTSIITSVTNPSFNIRSCVHVASTGKSYASYGTTSSRNIARYTSTYTVDETISSIGTAGVSYPMGMILTNANKLIVVVYDDSSSALARLYELTPTAGSTTINASYISLAQKNSIFCAYDTTNDFVFISGETSTGDGNIRIVKGATWSFDLITFSSYTDCGYAVSPLGVYTSQDSFVSLTNQIYTNSSGVYRLLYDNVNLYWYIVFVANTYSNSLTASKPIVYIQQPVLPSTVNSTDPEVGQYEYLPNGNLSLITESDMAQIDKSEYSTADVVNLGKLREGLNNRMRCRIRAESIFVKISSSGYPFAMERVAANADIVGDRKTVVEVD